MADHSKRARTGEHAERRKARQHKKSFDELTQKEIGALTPDDRDRYWRATRYGPSFVGQLPPYVLADSNCKALLKICGSNFTEKQRSEFQRHVSWAIRSYLGAHSQRARRNRVRIRRRLERIQKESLHLLTGFNTWQEIEEKEFGPDTGHDSGLFNIDEITRNLLIDAKVDLEVVKDQLLGLANASTASLESLERLPHKRSDYVKQNLVLTLAIIFRDVLNGTPTRKPREPFVNFVRNIARIAGVKKIGKDMIPWALNELNRRYIAKGTKRQLKDFPSVWVTEENIKVSYITPLVTKTPDGSTVYHTDVDPKHSPSSTGKEEKSR